MNSNQFYTELDYIEDFRSLTLQSTYKDIPEDWLVVLTDVIDSTNAINIGKYKSVNAVAASCIAGMLNITTDIDIPFVFGGDGASILVPHEYKDKAEKVLVGIRELAKTGFDLDLRVGIVPVLDVLNANKEFKVAKVKVSNNFYQAAFIGGGISFAEDLLKKKYDLYGISNDRTDGEINLEGFECRWSKVKSSKEETVSLIIKTRNENRIGKYAEILDKISEVYGDKSSRHPVRIENLKLSVDFKELEVESKLTNQNNTMRLANNIAAKGYLALGGKLDDISWGKYKESLIESTDHEKLDDTLRMVISGSVKQRESLISFLNEKKESNELFFGFHISDSALVTCLVFDRKDNHMHFVDGNDGGYVNAAKQLKDQIKNA